MPEIASLVELQVIGLLMLVALSPLAVFFASKKHQTMRGTWTALEKIDTTSGRAIVVLVSAFVLGAITNRLADDAISSLPPSLRGEAVTEHEFALIRGRATVGDSARVARSVKIAEFRVASESDYAERFVE